MTRVGKGGERKAGETAMPSSTEKDLGEKPGRKDELRSKFHNVNVGMFVISASAITTSGG